MSDINSVVAVFMDHTSIYISIKNLIQMGFNVNKISVVGKVYHIDEKFVGFFADQDRISFLGRRGACWDRLWQLFFGGFFVAIPVAGHVIVLGRVASDLIAGANNAISAGGLSVIGTALYGSGIPKESAIKYEATLSSDGFLVMVHGTPNEAARAKAILGTEQPLFIDLHGSRATGVKVLGSRHMDG